MTCVNCGALLTGKQEKYCSARCATAARRRDPERAARDRQGSMSWKERNRERNRARDREYGRRPEVRGTCDRCGGLLGIGNRDAKHCSVCVSALMHDRWDRIEQMWNAGSTMPEICAALDVTRGYLSVDMNRMRAAGRNLPYRYQLKKPRHQMQEAA